MNLITSKPAPKPAVIGEIAVPVIAVPTAIFNALKDGTQRSIVMPTNAPQMLLIGRQVDFKNEDAPKEAFHRMSVEGFITAKQDSTLQADHRRVKLKPYSYAKPREIGWS